MRTLLAPLFVALVIALAAVSCGGDSPSSPTPTPAPAPAPTPAPTPTPNPSTATITITANGASPRSVTIAAGGRVTFVNNDTRPHTMNSDPHPDHTTCPAINDVGFISPGQTKTSGNLTTVRTCGFHDHDQPSNTALTGTITIQ